MNLGTEVPGIDELALFLYYFSTKHEIKMIEWIFTYDAFSFANNGQIITRHAWVGSIVANFEV